MKTIKNFTIKSEEPGAGIEVQLENMRILFIDVYDFLGFLAKNDKSLFEFLCKQEHLKNASEEMVFLYELGIPFDVWLNKLIFETESKNPGWCLESSYPIFGE